MSKQEYSFDQVSVLFVHKAANYTGHRYRNYGVTAEDVCQEIACWLYGDGLPKVERWLESSPQQTTRIYRSMLDVALRYAEREKAERCGYKFDDVAWYTPNTIEGLMPLVLDPTYTQEKGQVGELITMVVDIRRVMTDDLYAFFLLADADDPAWQEHIRVVLDKLGGSRPYTGRRKVISNSHAQAITSEAVSG